LLLMLAAWRWLYLRKRRNMNWEHNR